MVAFGDEENARFPTALVTVSRYRTSPPGGETVAGWQQVDLSDELDKASKTLDAAGIVSTAQSIDRGVKQIITNLNQTLGIVQSVKGDSGNILGQAQLAHRLAACIDAGLPGPGSPADSHCR